MAPVKKRPDKKDILDEVREEVEKEMKFKHLNLVLPPEEKKQDTAPPGTQFINMTRMKFVSIAHELYRQYLYPNGANITINLPLKLHIDRGNVHRIFDSSGLSYFIPPSWIGIVTKPKPGAPNFVM